MHSTKIAPFTISFDNTEEFHILKKEVFTQGAYYFETKNPQPMIIDAGAHIGLSTLYFKKLFPSAKIIAIEPNPLLIPLLEQNIWQNNLQDVTVLPIALAAESGEKPLYIDLTKEKWWSTGSFEPGAWNHEQESREILVECQPLADLLTQPIDFLKLDIEGAEVEVLTAAEAQLHLVQQMMIEFHPGNKQKLAELIDLLKSHNFLTHIWKDGNEIKEVKRARGLVYVEAINLSLPEKYTHQNQYQ